MPYRCVPRTVRQGATDGDIVLIAVADGYSQEETGTPRAPTGGMEPITPPSAYPSPTTSCSAFNDDKSARLDILATDASGRQIDIEIQTYRQDFYFEGMLFYWSRLYGRQLGRGRNYTKLRPVIIVNILDLHLFAAGPWYRVDRLRFSDHLRSPSGSKPPRTRSWRKRYGGTRPL